MWGGGVVGVRVVSIVFFLGDSTNGLQGADSRTQCPIYKAKPGTLRLLNAVENNHRHKIKLHLLFA